MKNLVLAFVLLMGSMFVSCSSNTNTSDQAETVIDSVEVVTDTIEYAPVVEADSLVLDSIL